MSAAASAWAWAYACNGDAEAKLVLLALADNADPEGNIARSAVVVERVKARTGLALGEVLGAIERLEEMGALAVDGGAFGWRLALEGPGGAA